MALAPQSTEAFNQLIRLLADVRDDYVLSPERKPDELDAVEGFRYIFHLLSEGTELFLEGDPERPRFSSIVSPAAHSWPPCATRCSSHAESAACKLKPFTLRP